MNKELYEIPDFTGYYVNRNGEIYSVLKRGCRDKYNIKKWTSPKKLKNRYTEEGYARVCLRRDSTGKREDVYVHRIVALVFIPNPNNLQEINHLDCNRGNNNVENLEWITHKDNLKYGENVGNISRDSLGRFKSNMV